jgi:hypothetical protein
MDAVDTETPKPPRRLVVIGCDVGQKVDPTAIAVVEGELRADDPLMRRRMHFLARHIARLPLGTPYPDVARELARIVAGVTAQTGKPPVSTYIDATGVGQPLVDLLRERRVPVTPVYFTHGDRRTEDFDTFNGIKTVKLGKAYLVSRLQALLQSGRVHLPKTAETDALARELLDYEIKIDQDANDKYGAFRTGAHDDLVTALGLAVQLDPVRPFAGV